VAVHIRGTLVLAKTLEGEFTVPTLRPGTRYYLKVASNCILGLSPFSPTSEACCTTCAVPALIPQNPGIELVRAGCSSLTFGWQRAYCWGAPVTHYLLRVAGSVTALETDQCLEIEVEERLRETWPGMVYPAPLNASSKVVQELENKVLRSFIEHIFDRFGTLEIAWEWLDVNGGGDVSAEEFYGGDADNGPPFADFEDQQALSEVWAYLDADGGGAISINEFSKLRPAMQALQEGSCHQSYEGFCASVSGLKPGKEYYVRACAINQVGRGPWLDCGHKPFLTAAMTPAKMNAPEGVRANRTPHQVGFCWKLPYDNGAPLNGLELKWVAQDVEDGPAEKQVVRYVH